MTEKIRSLYFIVLFFLIFFNSECFSFDNEYVHQKINENAALQSMQFYMTLKNLGLKGNSAKDVLENIINHQTITFWFHEGSKLEDETHCRSKFHFHDPTKPWISAGLSNALIDAYCVDTRNRSSLAWAQDTDNLWTWQKARQYYFEALTASNKDLREQNFAYTFRALGQVMHLIADSSVPAHTRNDIHVFPFDIPVIGLTVGGPTFESWAKDNYKNLSYTGIQIDRYIFSQAVYSSLAQVPISTLWDQDKYSGTNPDITVGNSIGLAEYTNANFFSEDTIFSSVFPYPAWSSVIEYDEEITIGKLRTYLKKIKDGETINHFAAGKWFYKYLPSGLKSSGLKLDEMVYADYAQKLIPRAVGYSTGLLNYFFRGNIEITLPPSGIYAQTDNPVQGFTRINLLAKNTTSTGEEINDGSIELVVKYKLALEDPFQSFPVPTNEEFTYKVFPEANKIRSIPKDAPIELSFDLSQDSMPLYATDVYLQLIYKGKLGNEDGAVVVGFKDISEPTPIDIFNNMDKICLNGSWYVAGSPEAIAQVDTNGNGIPEWDIYPHDLVDAYLMISPISNPQAASSTEYTFYTPYIPAGGFYRAFILSDSQISLSDYIRTVETDPNDTSWIHILKESIWSGATIKNQVEYQVEQQEECEKVGATAPCDIRYYPLFYPFRGKNMWGPAGAIYDNPEYPVGSKCSWELLQ